MRSVNRERAGPIEKCEAKRADPEKRCLHGLDLSNLIPERQRADNQQERRDKNGNKGNYRLGHAVTGKEDVVGNPARGNHLGPQQRQDTRLYLTRSLRRKKALQRGSRPHRALATPGCQANLHKLCYDLTSSTTDAVSFSVIG